MGTARRLAVLFVACCWASVVASAQTVYRVDRVVDGDTVVLEGLGTVRLIGVDTPETVDPREPIQHFGVEAAEFLTRLLEGQRVRVDYDQQRTDKYQRTLGYLYLVDGTFVNREIVLQGYSHAYLKYPFQRMDEFREAEREARETRRGLWGEPTRAQTAGSVAARSVWVNTSSKVYHCPGARYFGKTARGEYMAEVEAVKRGHRPAGGKTCGGATTRAAPAVEVGTSGASALQTPTQPTVTDTRVWVNTRSRVYHCPGTRYYGTTKNGVFMSQQEARAKGYRPAYGTSCS